MKAARRRNEPVSVQGKAELWLRWKAGESMSDIGRAMGKAPGSIYTLLLAQGGIARSPRRRSEVALVSCEREHISRGLAAEDSIRKIARELRRQPSTVGREIARNGGRTHYRAVFAENRAWRRAKRPKPCRLAREPELCRVVAAKLGLDWSPQQIAGFLKREYPLDTTMHISHETIYRTLYVQARGALKKELTQHLRRHHPIRRSRNYSAKGDTRGQIAGLVSISERPPAVEDRAVPGHWEGDLLAGSKNTHIVTLVERQSRFVQLIKVSGKDSETVVRALTEHVQRLPEKLMESLTWDRGTEMSQHKLFTVATDVQVYFCDPQSPWQRGTNENTNGLLRQYFPKYTDLSTFTQAELDAVALRLNTRPRETLGFITPAEKLASSVATTG
ncbi:MAG TPA: IS30 family transposase [Thermoanaerobaculia bacterium]|nr:IS30 family transposase [Thermoanaerobaculia bacterium]